MKKISLLLTFFLSLLSGSLLSGCSTAPTDHSNADINTPTEIVSEVTTPKISNYVTVKYRSDPVDIANFETVDTSQSSMVRGAWYDEVNQYMIIDLNGVKYHYCRFPSSVWDEFKLADSFGTYYKSYIKWNYDCRNWGVPSY